MSLPRRFPKCAVCGTFGHPRGHCPVKELNREQELACSRTPVRLVLGLRPELEAQVALLRMRWRLELQAVST